MRTKSAYAIAVAIITLFVTGTGIVVPHAKSVMHPVSAARLRASDVNDKTFPVSHVVDGDTLDISVDGKVVRVRLIGLNTPETVDPRKTVECFGREASDQAKLILTGTDVRIETDPSQDLYDKYDRLLAYVYAPLNSKQEGLLMNRYMIAEGYGHEYTYDLPYKYQKDFKAAERSAREQKKGLWSDGVCSGI